ARSHLSTSTRQIKLRCFPARRFGDLDIAGLHMPVVELKDDSEASRLPLVEDGVVGFWLSGGEGNDQANSDKRHSDSQRSIVGISMIGPDGSFFGRGVGVAFTVIAGSKSFGEAKAWARATCDAPNAILLHSIERRIPLWKHIKK